MHFDFRRPIRPKPLRRLPFYQSIYKINGVSAPAGRHLTRVNFYLSGQDHITDFAAAFAVVGAATHHTLVRYYAESVVVDAYTVVLLTHNLRRHIARRATTLLRIVLLPQSRYSEVCDF